VIYYTTDGAAPTSSSATYTAPITVAGNGTNETIKAIAAETALTTSNVGSATYIIKYEGAQVAPPTFSPAGGTYSRDQFVTISCSTTGAAIHYTTDGSTPTSSSATYTAPITVAGNGTNETIMAIAAGVGMTASSVGTAMYAINYAWQTIGTRGSGANHFKYPVGVALDVNGHIYVVDQGNSRIVRMDDMNGTAWITLRGTGHSDHLNGANQFEYPAGVALDATGHIYVVDQGNSRIVRIDDDMSGSGWAAFGSFGSGTNQFINPAGIAVDASGHIYVVDRGNNRIVRMGDMDGTGWTALGERGSGANQFRDPAGVALDASGHIYVADYANSRIIRMDDMNGANWTVFGSSGGGTNQFRYPAGIAVDAIGHIFVADMINSRIVRMDDMRGTNWTTLGSAASQFDHPWGVEVDAIGHVSVADTLNDRIVRFAVP
jgi:sugar lactone lactonase YvrE